MKERLSNLVEESIKVGPATAAGSGMNTVLETGPGVWELRANLAARPATAKTVNMLKVDIIKPLVLVYILCIPVVSVSRLFHRQHTWQLLRCIRKS